MEETIYNCNHLRYIDTIMDNADGYKYWLHMYWALYDEKQPIKCMEGQELIFVNRDDGPAYLKLDFLLIYWDRIIKLLEKDLLEFVSTP